MDIFNINCIYSGYQYYTKRKNDVGQFAVIFGSMLIVPWFIICLITSLLINYLQTKFEKNIQNYKMHESKNVGKKILFIIVGIMMPIFIIFYLWCTDCWSTMNTNWGISMPYRSFYREIYHKDSGPSWFGDGTKYHVFSYRKEKYIEKMYDWETEEKETKIYSSYSKFIKQELDEIMVPEEKRPDYSKCKYLYNKDADDEIVICWNKDENKLYVIERII